MIITGNAFKAFYANKTETETETVSNAYTNPLSLPTYDGSNQAVHPSVLYFPEKWSGYEYWMAYTPYPYSNDDYENPSIAASNDGINWITPQGLANPIDKPSGDLLAARYHMSDTELVMANGTLECWYRFNKNGGTEQLLRKTSTDGINWSEREVVLDLTGSINFSLSPAVYEDGKYRLWFCGTGNHIYYTESPTGKQGTWIPEKVVPLSYRDSEYVTWHLDILKDAGKYIIIVNTMRDKQGSRYLLAGESEDGLSFSDVHLLLSPSETGWDNKELYRASLVKAGDTYRLYYSALSTDGKWNIGLAQGKSLDTLSTAFHTMKFDTAGGAEIASRLVGSNSGSAEPPKPIRIGYVFGGWYKEAACINEWNFSEDRMASDTTIYAKWNPTWGNP